VPDPVKEIRELFPIDEGDSGGGGGMPANDPLERGRDDLGEAAAAVEPYEETVDGCMCPSVVSVDGWLVKEEVSVIRGSSAGSAESVRGRPPLTGNVANRPAPCLGPDKAGAPPRPPTVAAAVEGAGAVGADSP
jgi:hypothetical protein